MNALDQATQSTTTIDTLVSLHTVHYIWQMNLSTVQQFQRWQLSSYDIYSM